MINEMFKAYPLIQSRVLSDSICAWPQNFPRWLACHHASAGTVQPLVLSNIAEMSYIDH